jgi:PDZ domain
MNFSALSQNGWTRLDKGKRSFFPIEGVRSSETPPSKLVCVHQMTIGRTSYHDLPMRVLPSVSVGFLADPNVHGLLGSDYFRRFVIALDLANDSLYLTPDRRFKIDQDRFSTIGIQFAKNSAGSFTVMAVWSPTPASEANLQVGDEVLFVNGSSTIAMTQEDLSRQLHGEPGRQIQIGLRSRGDQRTVRLTMRNILCQ